MFVSSMAVPKGKYSKLQGKKWSTFQLSKMIMALVLVLGFSMLLALRFFSPPESSHRNLPDRLASVQHRAVQRYSGNVSDCLNLLAESSDFDFDFGTFSFFEVMGWGREGISGLSSFHGSLELSFITISW